MFNLFIGDVDEDEVVAWLSESICPIGSVDKNSEWQYFTTFIGERNRWRLESTDVSDVSGCYDTMTQITFKITEDALMCKLRWGGSLVL